MHLQDCIVLAGPELTPHRCASFKTEGSEVTEIDLLDEVHRIETGVQIVLPGLVNSHTHMGDS
ncbi:MAG: amidohydrolase, partial [Verrucomicrobiota bacterium]